MTSKAVIRQSVRDKVRAIPSGERRALSAALQKILLAQPIWRDAHTVLLFASLPDEPDLTAVLESALQQGKRIALPRFEPGKNTYVSSCIQSVSELISGRFGALEPGPGCPLISLNQLDLVLAPGVAFDLAGRRLGRGKGFYDRLLAEVRGHKCGVAFDEQIVPEVPEEPHDVRVDSILTPSRWHSCLRAV